MNDASRTEKPKHREDATRRCHVCGCSDEDCMRCIIRTGVPCYWVGPNLCSACL